MKQFTSPLKAWEGSFSLPSPDEFSGAHWKVWTKAVNQPKRGAYAETHLFGYAGLDLLKKYGEWNLSIPIEEVRAWETNPDDERVKLISWIGREIRFYIVGIIDPKE